MSQDHIQEHVELIAKHEHDFLARRTLAERISDSVASFAGSLAFVVMHVLLLITWITLNTLGSIRPFDPAPFSLVGNALAFEAILLSSFILMRQTRTGRRAEERDHLMLQILLLAEKEITAVVSMNRQMAEDMGIHKLARDKYIEQFSQNTSIDDVARTIKESLPQE